MTIDQGRSVPVVSAVIVTYNCKEVVMDCLESLTIGQEPVSIEIIVIDNDSTDGTSDVLSECASRYPQLKVKLNRENVGFGRAANQGAELAHGRYLFLLNPDTAVKPGSLGILTRFLEEHPEIGVVGPKVLNVDGSVQASRQRIPTIRSLLFETWRLWRLSPVLFGGQRYATVNTNLSGEVEWVSGAAMMMTSQLFREVGGFDENFFLYYEDTDLCVRVRKQGFSIWYLPTAEIVHIGMYTSNKMRKLFELSNCQSSLYFFRKHRGWPWSAVLRLVLFVSSLAKGVVAYLIGFIRRDMKYFRIGQSLIYAALKVFLIQIPRKPV